MKTEMTRGTIAVILAAAAVSAEAATRCVAPQGAGGCHPTIQGAVNVSGPGDTIIVVAGTYFENVRVPPGKDGLVIAGPAASPAAVVDASPHVARGITHSGDGFTISSARVQLRDLAVHNGNHYAVRVEAADVVLERLYIAGPEAAGIYVTPEAARPRIRENQVRATRDAIHVEAPDAVVENNAIYGSVHGISTSGDRATLTGNGVTSTLIGITASGSGLVVRHNRTALTNVAFGIRDAVDPTVHGNEGRDDVQGIQVNCDSCAAATVTNNVLTDNLLSGLVLFPRGPGLQARGNRITGGNSTGVHVGGNDVRLENNVVSTVGTRANPDGLLSDSCVEIRGDRNLIIGNSVARCAGAGFDATFGSGNQLRQNEARDSFNAGFHIRSDDNRLAGNRAFGNAREGFRIDTTAERTRIEGNSASGNAVDYCDNGIGTVATGNSFGTSCR
jgi:parallel beta-helix repeat protein